MTHADVVAGHIQDLAATYERLRDTFLFQERGMTEVNGKGKVMTYLLVEEKAPEGPSL